MNHVIIVIQGFISSDVIFRNDLLLAGLTAYETFHINVLAASTIELNLSQV